MYAMYKLFAVFRIITMFIMYIHTHNYCTRGYKAQCVCSSKDAEPGTSGQKRAQQRRDGTSPRRYLFKKPLVLNRDPTGGIQTNGFLIRFLHESPRGAAIQEELQLCVQSLRQLRLEAAGPTWAMVKPHDKVSI